jgi:hypothetical protein
MTQAVLAQAIAPAEPAPIQAGWDALEVVLDAGDGSRWTLSEPDSGVFIVRGGVRGLGFPKIQHYRDQNAGQNGAVHRDLVYDSRQMMLPIYLYHDGSTKEWVEHDRAFAKALHPRREGVLSIRVPGVSVRSIRIRLEGDGDWVPELDPTYFGWALYGLLFQADQPLWEGPDVYKVFGTTEVPRSFLADEDNVIFIGSGRSLESATITNPGDEATYARWTSIGPLALNAGVGAVITVGGHTLEIPIALDADEAVVVDTDPEVQSAWKGIYDAEANVFTPVEDVFHLLGEYDPAPIPADVEVPLSLQTATGARIRVDLPTRYLRAW